MLHSFTQNRIEGTTFILQSRMDCPKGNLPSWLLLIWAGDRRSY